MRAGAEADAIEAGSEPPATPASPAAEPPALHYLIDKGVLAEVVAVQLVPGPVTADVLLLVRYTRHDGVTYGTRRGEGVTLHATRAAALRTLQGTR